MPPMHIPQSIIIMSLFLLFFDKLKHIYRTNKVANKSFYYGGPQDAEDIVTVNVEVHEENIKEVEESPPIASPKSPTLRAKGFIAF